MKKKDLFILLTSISGVILFYKQSAGLNYLILSALLTLLQIADDNTHLFKPKWWLLVLFSMISGIGVFYNGNTLAAIANICCLMCLASYSAHPGSSVFVSLLQGAFSALSSSAFVVRDTVLNRLNARNELSEKRKTNIFQVVIVPLFITVLFLLIYRFASADFKELTKNISFSFITPAWLLFCIICFLLSYAFFLPRIIPILLKHDLRNGNALLVDASEADVKSPLLYPAISLFSLLNLLLLLVNAADINGLFVVKTIPAGLSYSDYLHQGIWATIGSIVLATALILFFLRGNFQLRAESRPVKILVYLWILQNLFLLFTAAYKNGLYVNEYSLTYKRIGTFIYLLLAGIGLFTCLSKVIFNRNGWFLWRTNSLAAIAMLPISAMVPWDFLIANFNLSRTKNPLTMDTVYLESLSHQSLPALIQFHVQQPQLYDLPAAKTIALFNEVRLADAREYCQGDILLAKQVAELFERNKIRKLDLSSTAVQNLGGLSLLPQVNELDVSNSSISHLNFLKECPQIEVLDISYCRQLHDYSGLQYATHLKELRVINLPDSVLAWLKSNRPNLKIHTPIETINK